MFDIRGYAKGISAITSSLIDTFIHTCRLVCSLLEGRAICFMR